MKKTNIFFINFTLRLILLMKAFLILQTDFNSFNSFAYKTTKTMQISNHKRYF